MKFREFKKFRTAIVGRHPNWAPEARANRDLAYQVVGMRADRHWEILAVFPSRSGAREYVRLMKRGRAAAVQQKGRTIVEHVMAPNPLIDDAVRAVAP